MKCLTSGGMGQLITFERFIIERVGWCKGQQPKPYKEFDSLIEYSPFNYKGVESGDEPNTSTYQRCITAYCPTMEGLRASVLTQCQILPTQYMKNIREIGEEFAIKSVEKYGNPEYFVQLAPRLYLATCAEDWRVYEDVAGNRAIIGVAKGRNLIINVSRMTENEKNKLVQEYLDKQK